jgi:hypothetical protein
LPDDHRNSSAATITVNSQSSWVNLWSYGQCRSQESDSVFRHAFPGITTVSLGLHPHVSNLHAHATRARYDEDEIARPVAENFRHVWTIGEISVWIVPTYVSDVDNAS